MEFSVKGTYRDRIYISTMTFFNKKHDEICHITRFTNGAGYMHSELVYKICGIEVKRSSSVIPSKVAELELIYLLSDCSCGDPLPMKNYKYNNSVFAVMLELRTGIPDKSFVVDLSEHFKSHNVYVFQSKNMVVVAKLKENLYAISFCDERKRLLFYHEQADPSRLNILYF
jgi:hypothetical protein